MRYRTLLAGAIIYLSCIACAKKTLFSFENRSFGIKALQKDSAGALFIKEIQQETSYSNPEISSHPTLSDNQTIHLPAQRTDKEKKAFRQYTEKKRILVPKAEPVSGEIVPEKKVNYFTLFLLAAFFPPLAVGIKKDFTSWQFFLTLGLTLSLFLPGMIFAMITILREKGRE